MLIFFLFVVVPILFLLRSLLLLLLRPVSFDLKETRIMFQTSINLEVQITTIIEVTMLVVHKLNVPLTVAQQRRPQPQQPQQ